MHFDIDEIGSQWRNFKTCFISKWLLGNGFAVAGGFVRPARNSGSGSKRFLSGATAVLTKQGRRAPEAWQEPALVVRLSLSKCGVREDSPSSGLDFRVLKFILDTDPIGDYKLTHAYYNICS
jgi:hypothetical protein